MNWAYRFTPEAQQNLYDLPKHIQKRIIRTLNIMYNDPFGGDVKALSGPEWHRVFRRRIGNYRLLFEIDRPNRVIIVVQISLRSDKTYR